MTTLLNLGLKPLPQYEEIECVQVKHGQGHRYRIEGRKGYVTSVTTFTGVINKPGIPPWARKMAARKFAERMLAVEDANRPGEDGYSDYIQSVQEWAGADDRTAADDGTAAHAMIEAALLGKAHDVDPIVAERVTPAVEGALKAIAMLGLTTVGLEVVVYNPIEDYAGQIDYLGQDNTGQLVILDWKRSKDLYPEYAMQVAAYAYALGTTLGSDFISGTAGNRMPAAMVCKLPQEPGQDVEVRRVDVAHAFQQFLQAKALYQMLGNKSLSPWA